MKSHLTLEQAKAILLHYPFYSGEIESFAPLTHSFTTNNNYKLVIGDDVYLLKKISPHVSPARLDFSNKILQQLNSRSFPAPKLQYNTEGKCVTCIDNKKFQMLEWIEGINLKIDYKNTKTSTAIVGDIARLLADYHKVVSLIDITNIHGDCIMTAQSAFKAPAFFGRNLWAGTLRKPSYAARLRCNFFKNQFSQWILETIPFVKYHAERLLDIGNDVPSLLLLNDRILPCHTDIHPDNLIAKNNIIVGIIDYDNVLAMPVDFDIGATIAVVCNEEMRLVKHFIREYSNACGDQIKPDFLLETMRWRYVKALIWSFLGYLQGKLIDEDSVESWCRKCVSLLEWLDREQNQFAERSFT